MRRFCRGLVGLAGLASILAATAVAPTYAADLPAPAPAYYPPVLRPALYDWTGLYVGGQIGAAQLSDRVSQATAAPLTAILTSPTPGPAGVIGGGQVGVNYEFAPWVVGVEGAWSVTNLSGYSTVMTGTVAALERATSAPLWIAAATGRFGYAANDLLFYAKGGFAWMQVRYGQDILGPAGTGNTQSISDTRHGFTAGAGIEYGMTENLSARLEYDYFDFGSRTYNFFQTPASIKSQLHELTVGINYRFTWPGGTPLVVR